MNLSTCCQCGLPVLELEGQFAKLDSMLLGDRGPPPESAGWWHARCLATSAVASEWAAVRLRNIAVGDAARIGDRLALLGEDEVVVVEADGTVATRIPAPDGFHFRRIETVGGELVVLAPALDGSRVRFVRVHL